MCGRFAFHRSHGQIRHNVAEDLGHDVDDWVDGDAFYPRYNVAPRTYSPVIRARDTSPSALSERDTADAAGPSRSAASDSESSRFVLHSMRWGVVPHWSKADSFQMNTINARAENVVEGGGMWASMKGSKRCIVPCDGWSPKTKLPHFLRHENKHLMFFAGLWDCVRLPGSDKPLFTFSIITTEAPSAYAWLHDRQPVILSAAKDIEAWLDPSRGWSKELARILQPYKGTKLDCYQVPQEVGKVGNESPAFDEPIQERKDGIEAMFAKQAKTAVKSEGKQAGNLENRRTDRREEKGSSRVKREEGPADSRQEAPAAMKSEPERDLHEKPAVQQDDRDVESPDRATSNQPNASSRPLGSPKTPSKKLKVEADNASSAAFTAPARATPSPKV
ncbi:hypothetical protein HDZ31DRAFT_86221 [Schizophyllum fasciatum]